MDIPTNFNILFDKLLSVAIVRNLEVFGTSADPLYVESVILFSVIFVKC
jgi:hypothetical protein